MYWSPALQQQSHPARQDWRRRHGLHHLPRPGPHCSAQLVQQGAPVGAPGYKVLPWALDPFTEEGGYEVENFFLPGKYTIKPDPATKEDFALLKLKKRVSNVTQEDCLRLNGEYQQLVKEKEEVCLFGYPFPKYEVDDGDRYTARPWGVVGQGRVVDIQAQKGKVFHKLSTLLGHSGSPILRTDQSGGLSVIGIHKGVEMLGGEAVNVGRLVTPELISVLEAGARSMEAGLENQEVAELRRQLKKCQGEKELLSEENKQLKEKNRELKEENLILKEGKLPGPADEQLPQANYPKLKPPPVQPATSPHLIKPAVNQPF